MATADTDAEASSTDVAAAGGRDDDDAGKPAAAFPELQFSSPQDGGGDDGGGGGGPGSDDPAAADLHDEEDGEASASSSLRHEPPPPPLGGSPPAAAAIAPAASGSASASAPPKASEEPERPFRRTFQIPRKSREKKALFQPLTPGSREFEDVLSILHSSFLEPTSVASFTYRRACLIHNELLEKEFTEKRRELKFDGRLDKELSESYAFLLVDRYQVQSICEKGLQVGHSKVTILGSPSMGIYLSRYADLLQANPLEAGAVGDVVIFKIMKGKIKSIYDPMSVKSLEPVLNKSALDPTPKHECHVSKNASRITSLLAYRAYELTQYYFYEYGFDELRRRPRHVCPYAVVSFIYKDDMQSPKFMSSLRSNSFNADRNIDRCTYYTLWKGQLLNRGKLLCPISLRSTTRAFLPIKLPEKLDVETVMSIDHLKQKIPPALFYKDTYLGPSEVLKNGMYCSLYEVVEQTRIGSNMESLLQKLEREKLVLVKPLQDRGYLFLLSPYQMMSPYEHQTVKSRMLQALFLFQEPRCLITSHRGSAMAAAPQERQDGMPDMIKIAQFLQFSLIQCRKEFKSINTVNFHSAMEKYVSEFFKRGFGSGKREFFMFSYDSRLDDKKFLYSAPRNKSHIDDCLHTYIFRPDVYQLLVSQLEDLFEENRRRLQFSPLPDYEGQEDEASGAKTKCGRRNSVRGDVIQPETQKSCHSLDYDEDRVKELIDLIQCKKKHVSEDPDTEDMRSKTPSKRKLEDVPDNARKFAKTSSISEIYHLYEESPQPVALLGREPDLRLQQQDACSPAIADRHKVYHWLSKTLANARHSDAALTDTVNKALGLSTDSACEELRPELPCEHEQALGASARSPLLEADVASLKYPSALAASQLGADHKLHLKEDPNVINVNHFEECSLCPTVPIEHGFHRHQPKSNDDEETEIHWKLIPITGCSRPGGNTKSPEDQHGKRGDRHTPGVPSLEESLACLPPQDTFPSDPRGISRERSCDYQPSSSPFADLGRGTSEEGMLPGQGMAVEEQCVPAAELSPVGETTESTVLGEFHLFSRKIEEILKQKNVSYVSRISTPVFSTQEKMKRLSEFIYCKTSKAGIQEFVDGFHEKLNTIIIKASATGENLPPNDPEVKTAVNPPERQGTSMSSGDFTCKDAFEPLCTHEELSSISAEAEMNQAHHCPKLMVTSDYALPADTPREPQEKETSPPGGVNISAPPALSSFISQLEPEVFNSLVKIMKDVQKNTVKFYIHEEEKSVLSKEIKEYLTKLGNTECHPERFLERRSQLDKLLVIIQNEDIAGFIHKVPGLVTLKKLPCVSFAGVDSLDDVKNHTYNELFVSGGFIVSDESVMNLDVVTIESLKMFLTFLEELSTPEGKWQWKIHCKFQKKLKELGRLNRNALSLLSLLNAYQKKHLVEILSYHKCDSQTRNAPELDCLIRLQAQNIQQRHIVFLTEKNIKMLSSYTDNGVIVASAGDFMQNFQSLVGYHSSSTEESLPQLGAHESLESQSALLENDEKDEEEMSLDSEDEISHIEVFSSFHSDTLKPETKGSSGTDPKQNIQMALHLLEETYQADAEETGPAAAVCSAGEPAGLEAHRSLPMSRQFSHFNVLTHQTFLELPHALASSQSHTSHFLSASKSSPREGLH